MAKKQTDETFWEQEALKNRKKCSDLLVSNNELIDISSTIIATAILDKAARHDLSEKLKQVVLKATRLKKKIIQS